MGYTLSKLYDVELLHRQALKLRTYIEDALYPYIALQDCLVVDMERIEDTPIIYNTITQKVYENGQWSKQDLDLHGETINLCKIQSSYACSNRTNKQWILNSKFFMSRRETFMGFPSYEK